METKATATVISDDSDDRDSERESVVGYRAGVSRAPDVIAQQTHYHLFIHNNSREN